MDNTNAMMGLEREISGLKERVAHIREGLELLKSLRTARHGLKQIRRCIDGTQSVDLPGAVAALDMIAGDIDADILDLYA